MEYEDEEENDSDSDRKIVIGNKGREMIKHILELIRPWEVRKEGLVKVTYRGNLAGYREPLVTTQKSYIRSAPSGGIRLENNTPGTGKQPHLYRLKRQAHQPKKN
jgi:hypothetical protein